MNHTTYWYAHGYASSSYMHKIHAIKVDEMSVFEFGGCCRKRELDTSSVVLHGGEWPFSFFFHLPAISQYSYACSSSTPAKRWQNFHHTHPSIHYTLIHKITYPHKRQQEHVASETCVPNFSRLTRNLQEVLILFLTGHIIWACISLSI